MTWWQTLAVGLLGAAVAIVLMAWWLGATIEALLAWWRGEPWDS